MQLLRLRQSDQDKVDEMTEVTVASRNVRLPNGNRVKKYPIHKLEDYLYQRRVP